MNIDLLKTFLEVAKTRHFGMAAENLYLTQAAISSRIKQLEEILGVQLFTRERHNILLTPAGERLLQHSKNILTAWQVAVQEVGTPEHQSVQFVLGGTSNIWDSFLQVVLPEVAATFPDMNLRTEVNSSQELIRALLSGRVDLITVLDQPQNMDIETTCIGQLELLLVSSQEGVCVDELGEVGYVHIDWGTAFNLRHASLIDSPLAPVLHTGQASIALEFILSRGGGAFLPRTLIQAHLEDGSLFAIDNIDTTNMEVYGAFLGSSEKADAINSVLKTLSKKIWTQ